MPTFRIVYVEDETFVPRTLTASFPDRASAEAAMAMHGHRIVQLAELRAGERATDPIELRMPPACEKPAEETPESRGREPLPTIPRFDLAGIAVTAVAMAAVSAALLMF